MEKKYINYIISFILVMTTLILLIAGRASSSFVYQYGLPIILSVFLFSLFCLYTVHYYIMSGKKIEIKNHVRNKELLKNIIKISNSVLSFENPEEIYDLILNKAVKSIDDAKMGSLLIVNKDNKLEYKAAVGYDFNKLKNISLDLEDCFLYNQNHNNIDQACIIKDIHKFDKKKLDQPTYRALYQANAFVAKTTISAPIKLDDEFYGIINVDSDKVHSFTAMDLSFMEYFAIQVSTVIQNHNIYKKMFYLARYDSQTQLYNRPYFEELSDNMLDRAKRYGENFSLAIFDIDNLKITNDTYGHQVGDKLIQRFASKLKASSRKSDVISRYGGDEFVAIYLYADPREIREIINKLNAELDKNPLYTKQGKVYIKYSYGVSHFPSDGRDMKTLLKVADSRMYLLKDGFIKENSQSII